MRRRMVRVAALGAGALSLVMLAGFGLLPPGGGGAGAARAQQDSGESPRGPDGRTDTVTLLTGDQVRITRVPGSRPSIEVLPGPGRADIPFVDRVTEDGRIAVIPADALELLGQGRLDPRLFDVSLLRESGYRDAETDALPLIVEGSDTARQQALSESGTPGVVRARHLGGLDVSAVRTTKADAGAFWNDLVAGDRTMAAGIEKVWLDGPVHASLDESVEQIGAPDAWDSKLTGQGVTVAVLDTGIDTEHPDLADAVTAQRDFSGTGGPGDVAGHGTHVASIITGSGEASDGRYAGVAPDAELLNGKVLDDSGGGLESAILEGMQWAVENEADVVNMSLGGCAVGSGDPLTEAIDELTESSGTLFVVAAGNHDDQTELPCRLDEAVSSPATADHALAVGSVDKSDRLSDFSNVGPRQPDGAIKPEVTAPGEEITAARAAASEGEGRYVAYSGTSMAAPHVAGAAAILAEQHPNWQAKKLRDRLTATAEPNPELGVFEQGAGRVAVAAAIEESPVTASPAMVSAPRATWPHGDDEPWSTPLTYHNTGDEPVTLRLDATGTGPEGEPAPEGMFALDQETLTVPAGEQRRVTLGVDTTVSSPDGLYSGQVIARTADGERLARTPIGVQREPESYDLTLRVTDRNGDPIAGTVLVTDPANDDLAEVSVPKNGRTMRLPAGRYDLSTAVFTETAGEGQESLTLVTKPDQSLESDRTLVLDAREGERVGANVPSSTAEPVDRQRTWVDNGKLTHGAVGGPGDGNRPSTTLFVTPTGKLDEQRYEFGFLGALAEPLTEERPQGYHLYLTKAGGVPSSPMFDVKHRDLARVRNIFHAQGVRDEQQGQLTSSPVPPGDGLLYEMTHDVRTPGARVDYYSAPQGLTWHSQLETARSIEYNGTGWSDIRYEPGQAYTERWNAAPVGVLLRSNRAYDRFWNGLSVFAPSSPGHTSRVADPDGTTATFTMRRNGEEVLRTSDPNGGDPVDLPADRATYDWRLEADRDVPWSDLGTQTTAHWQVTAAPNDDGQLPIPSLWITGDVDRRGRAPADRPFEARLRVELYDGSVPEVRELDLKVSFDDGETWRDVRVEPDDDGFTATVPKPPRGTEAVSLRSGFRTVDGAEVNQTVIRAYGVSGS